MVPSEQKKMKESEASAAEKQSVESRSAEAYTLQPKQQMYNLKNIDIALDTYDDIFSDFDISQYSKRQLSEDFIIELLRRAPVPSPAAQLQVVLSIPRNARNLQEEKVIQKRIRHVFGKKLQEINDEIRAYQQKGIKYIIIGSVITSLTLLQVDSALIASLFNLLHVAGWFGIWTGLSKIFDEPSELVKARKAYQALSTAQYIFLNEEDARVG